MNLINLTGREFVLRDADDKVARTILADGPVIVVEPVTVSIGYVEDIPIREFSSYKITSLPPAKRGTYYIVTPEVFAVCQRPDMLYPGGAVYDDINGALIGYRYLIGGLI